MRGLVKQAVTAYQLKDGMGQQREMKRPVMSVRPVRRRPDLDPAMVAKNRQEKKDSDMKRNAAEAKDFVASGGKPTMTTTFRNPFGELGRQTGLYNAPDLKIRTKI